MAGSEGTEIDRQFYFFQHLDYQLATGVHQAESLSAYLPSLPDAADNDHTIVN